MAINRRHFLGAAACTFALQSFTVFANGSASKYLASRHLGVQNVATVFTSDGEIITEYELPGRGHGGAFSARTGHAVIFARRPDRFALILRETGTQLHKQIECPANRHFYGHGFYSTDGAFLFAIESDFDNRRSVLGVYAVSDGYQRISEIDCEGIGAHEVILMSDQRTAAVAVGGIETHPDYPRQKLNIPEMKPSLNFVDLKSKKVIGKYQLPDQLHKLSIRHIAEGAEGSVVFAGQYEGANTDNVPLLGVKRAASKDLEIYDLAPEVLSALRLYVGSIAAQPLANNFAITAPRGNRAFVLDVVSGKLQHEVSVDDICGVSITEKGYVFSTGQGALLFGQKRMPKYFTGNWDNHITALS